MRLIVQHDSDLASKRFGLRDAQLGDAIIVRDVQLVCNLTLLGPKALASDPGFCSTLILNQTIQWRSPP